MPRLLGPDDPYLVNERKVHPGETDSRISDGPGKNAQFAYVSSMPALRKQKLFIMLPGTLSNPGDYKLILKAAAAKGYHSMGIAYDNNQTLADVCDGSSDPDCLAKVFDEYLTGNNTSAKVDISPSHSFENRILKMLRYLHHHHPNEGWDQYFSNENEINWEQISLAGHSQGATHTLYIARKRKLLRAAFYSGPNGFKKGGGFPQWVDESGLTPTEHLFAFNHKADRLSEWTEVTATWDAIGLKPGEVSVDSKNDYNGRNRFYTRSSKIINLFTGAHGATCSDKDTPLDRDREPKFEEVWSYMSFP